MNIKYFTALVMYFGLTTISIAQCPTENVILQSQIAIDNFPTDYPGCTIIPTDVSVIILDGSLMTITNLNGLNQITAIEGNFGIRENGLLTNVDGLNQITTIGGNFWIWDNNLLTNLNGLNQISSVGGELWIEDNDALTNIDGFSEITSVGGDIQIQGNAALVNINGLNQLAFIGGDIEIIENDLLLNVNGLSQLTTVEENLYIIGNDALTNLNGLNQVTTVQEILQIRENASLTNVDGLSQITSIGDLSINNNGALTNVDGLSQTNSVGGFLRIENNSQLNQCCALCPLFVAEVADPSVIGGNITIENNLTGCNSEAEINACSPCDLVSTPMPEHTSTQLNIYPNPAKNILHFQYDSPTNELVYFTIENHLGQQVIQSQAYTNQPISIDISDYPVGLYSLTVLREGESMSQLFSVNR